MTSPQKQAFAAPSSLAPIPSSWVMANAGSGKTYTLTWRVVGLLLRGVVPESIWCVTYTNAAAAEMSERLMDTLKKLHHADDAALLKQLSEALPDCATESMLSAARALYPTLLQRTHGGVRYTTMHGLCQWLLQAFPLEAGISEGAALLDDAETAKMRRDAVRHVLAMPFEDENPIYWARQHVVSVANYTHAIELLEKAMEVVTAQPFPRDAASLRAEIKLHLALEEGAASDEEMHGFLHGQPDLSAAISAMLESPKETDQRKAEILEQWVLASPETRPALYLAYRHVFVTKTALTPAKTVATKQAVKTDSLAHAQLMQEQARVHAHIERLSAYELAEDTAALQILAQAAVDVYQQRKAVEEALDYDDLLRIAHRLISHSDMMPWIMHKLDYRLEHLLVDEAQDTSPLQWQMIRSFCEDIIAQGEASTQPKTLFVVGDEKQSIYSFNGAAPDWLGKMYDQLNHTLPDGVNEESLATSYRSSQAVLDWVNALCADQEMAKAMAGGEVSPHQLHHEGVHGFVECWPLAEAGDVEEMPAYSMPTEYIEAKTAQAALGEQIAEQLKTRLLGMPLREGKPATPGDVLVLVRSRSALVGHIYAALMKRGIPVAGLDRLRLTEHPAVHDMMALIAWCLQPEDEQTLAHVMMSPLLNMQPETLEQLALSRGDSLLWQLLQTEQPEAASQLLAWQEVSKQGAYALVQAALVHDGRAKMFCQRMGKDALGVLDELQLYLFEKQQAQRDALPLVLHALQREAPVIKREQHSDGDNNTVRIMTVHGAKGLQAPIVVLASPSSVDKLKEGIYPRDEYGWVAIQPHAKFATAYDAAKDEKRRALNDEYYRLLYVAATRAEDVLIVAGAGKQQKGSWYEVMRAQLRKILGEEMDESGILRHEAGQALPLASTDVDDGNVAGETPAWLAQQPKVSPKVVRLRPSYLDDEADAYAQETVRDEREDNSDPQAYGNCFHALMEWATESVTDDDIARFAALHGQPDARLQKEFRGLWQALEVAELLRMPATCEQDIVARFSLNDTPCEFRGQIDRLIITEKECIVLDYKTSLTPPERMPEKYKRQLQSYVLMLRKLLPNHQMRAALLWTVNAKLDWLRESDLSIEEESLYDVPVT